MKRATGHYETTTIAGESARAFVPKPLPPRDPPLNLGGRLKSNLAAAAPALAGLDVAKDIVPSSDWLIYAFARKEAVLSAQIEGVQATLDDLLTVEATDSGSDADLREVFNYLDALRFAQDEIHKPGRPPLSRRLLDESHKRLLAGARGANKQPGEVRRSQNWIGGKRPGDAAYVPPPPHLLSELLSDLERYIHDERSAEQLPPLVRVALVHAQFETIHPYLDGNGRLGRLLISLLLDHWKVPGSALLYLSLHFMRHRDEYYRLLNAVRTRGDWEAWVLFFLDGVTRIAVESTTMARDLSALVSADRKRVLGSPSSSVTALRLVEQLPRHPIVTVARVTKLLSTSKPTSIKAIQTLVKARVLVESTGRKRDRLFRYKDYLQRLGRDE